VQRWVDGLLLIAIAALPFHLPLVHQSPNIGAGDVVAGVALLAYFSTSPLPRPILVRIGVLILALLPSVVVALDRRHAALQLAGLAYVMLLSGAAWSLAQRRRQHGLVALVAGAALACLGGVFITQSSPWMSWPRPIGSTESPAMLSMIALAGLFAVRALEADHGPSLGRWRLLALLFWATLAAARTRILFVAIIGVAVEAWPRRRALATTTIAVAGALFVASLLWRLVPLSSSPPYFDRSPSPYAVCHDAAWRAFAAHPLTGVGLRGFHAAWPRYVDERAYDEAFAPLGPRPWDPHATLQGYLAEAGLPALLLLGFLAVDVWRRRGSTVYFVALVLASCTLDLLTERTSWALVGLFSVGIGARACAARSDR
jgi:O-antigen ligase/polysaccharide polymerase Wzy-like membrane protein